MVRTVTMKTLNENELVCPIPGCQHTYGRGKTGWFQHVARPENHPTYHKEITSQNLRAEFFRKEFPAFFAEDKRVTLIPGNGAPPPASVPPSTGEHAAVQTCLRQALELAISTGDVRAIRVVATAIATLTETRTVSGVREAAAG